MKSPRLLICFLLQRVCRALVCGVTTYSVATAETPDPGPRLNLGQGRIPAGRISILTLERAYDRALASDQSIGIAYLRAKSSDLLRWRALTRLEPRMRGTIGWGGSDESRTRSSESSTTTNSQGSDLALKNSSTSNFVPKHTATALQLDEGQREIARTPFDSLSRDSRSSSASVILEQPLLDLTVFPAWRAGKISAQAARLECQFIIREVLFAVARSYYEVLRSEAVASIDRQTLQLSRDQLEIAHKRYDAGDALRTDVLRAQANVENASRKLVESETAVRVARIGLADLLNLPAGTSFSVVEPASASLDVATVEAATHRAYLLREDYRVSALQVDQELQLRRVVDAGYFPRLSAQVRAGWVDDHEHTSSSSFSSRSNGDSRTEFGATSDLTRSRVTPASGYLSQQTDERIFGDSSSHSSTSTNAWEALLVFEMPMWGRNTIDRKQASLQISQAVLQQEKVSKQVHEEVTEAWLGVESLRQTLKSLDAEVAALEQSYTDLQHQYEAGSATILDTLVALRDLNAARTLKISQVYDLEVAIRQLQRSMGGFQQERVASLKMR